MKSAFTCSLQLMVSHKALLWPLCYDCTDFLKCSIQKLECEFLSLGEKFQKFVENNQYTVKDLRSKLSWLPRDVNSHVFPLWSRVQDLVKENAMLDTLFSVLNADVWNFLDYYLLEHFIKTLADPELQKMVNEYIRKLDRFKETTLVQHFIECWPGHNRDLSIVSDCKELIITFNRNDITLKDLDDFRNNLRRKYFPPLSDFASLLYYHRLKTGSIIVSWLIHSELAALLEEKEIVKSFTVYEVKSVQVTAVTPLTPEVKGEHSKFYPLNRF